LGLLGLLSSLGYLGLLGLLGPGGIGFAFHPVRFRYGASGINLLDLLS
jgi:hypothetical protein